MKNFFVLLSIGVIFFSTNAFSSTMTFDSLANGTVISTYTESGLTAEVLWTYDSNYPRVFDNFATDGKAMHSEGATIKYYLDNGLCFNLDQIYFDAVDGENSYITFSNGDSDPIPSGNYQLIDYTSDSFSRNLAYFTLYLPDEGTCSQIDYINFSSSCCPVPEPATLFLLGGGLLGFAGFGRKKFFKK